MDRLSFTLAPSLKVSGHFPDFCEACVSETCRKSQILSGKKKGLSGFKNVGCTLWILGFLPPVLSAVYEPMNIITVIITDHLKARAIPMDKPCFKSMHEKS